MKDYLYIKTCLFGINTEDNCRTESNISGLNVRHVETEQFT